MRSGISDKARWCSSAWNRSFSGSSRAVPSYTLSDRINDIWLEDLLWVGCYLVMPDEETPFFAGTIIHLMAARGHHPSSNSCSTLCVIFLSVFRNKSKQAIHLEQRTMLNFNWLSDGDQSVDYEGAEKVRNSWGRRRDHSLWKQCCALSTGDSIARLLPWLLLQLVLLQP